jgi:hypothetical protein
MDFILHRHDSKWEWPTPAAAGTTNGSEDILKRGRLHLLPSCRRVYPVQIQEHGQLPFARPSSPAQEQLLVFESQNPRPALRGRMSIHRTTTHGRGSPIGQDGQERRSPGRWWSWCSGVTTWIRPICCNRPTAPEGVITSTVFSCVCPLPNCRSSVSAGQPASSQDNAPLLGRATGHQRDLFSLEVAGDNRRSRVGIGPHHSVRHASLAAHAQQSGLARDIAGDIARLGATD